MPMFPSTIRRFDTMRLYYSSFASITLHKSRRVVRDESNAERFELPC